MDNDELRKLVGARSPFYQAAVIGEKAKALQQPQLPGLEDAVDVIKHVESQRMAAIQNRDPDLERLYQLANVTPRDMEEALEALNEIRDAVYRLLR